MEVDEKLAMLRYSHRPSGIKPMVQARQLLNSILQFASDCLKKFVVKLSTPFTIPTMNADQYSGEKMQRLRFEAGFPSQMSPMTTDDLTTVFFQQNINIPN